MPDRAPSPTIRRGEQGQAAPLALVAVLLAALLTLGIARLGSAAGTAAMAQASADAVALAGAAEGEAAAGAVAAANEARLVRFEQVGDDVQVVVERRGATATARARWQPAPIP